MQEVIDRVSPILKAVVGVAVAAASPAIIAAIENGSTTLTTWAVGIVVSFLGGLAVWATPNRSV